MIRQAAAEGAQLVCLQEIFYGPYFCAEQSTRWYDSTERVPDGPTIKLMQALARELGIALIVPVYEVENEGVYYNTAAVIDRQGRYLGKYRARRSSRRAGFLGGFYFWPRQFRYPVFDLGFRRSAFIYATTVIFPRARGHWV